MFIPNLLVLLVFGREIQMNQAGFVGGISKESMIVPDAFWTFSNSNHEVSHSPEEVGYIRNATFDTNYPQYTGPTGDRALQFWGTSTSYIQFPNDQGALDGSEWGAWFFYINIDTDVGEATILEYEGACPGGQGFSIRCINGYLHVSFYTSSGVYETGNSPVKLTPGIWSYIGVTWHYLQPMVYVNYNGAVLYNVIYHNLQSADRVEAHGNVKIGGSFTSDTPFRGRLACLWYQKGYYIKTNKTPMDFCDRNMRSAAMSLGWPPSVCEVNACVECLCFWEAAICACLPPCDSAELMPTLAVTDIAILPATGCFPTLVDAPLTRVEDRCEVVL